MSIAPQINDLDYPIINYLPNSIKSGAVYLYADDTTLYCIGKTVNVNLLLDCALLTHVKLSLYQAENMYRQLNPIKLGPYKKSKESKTFMNSNR